MDGGQGVEGVGCQTEGSFSCGSSLKGAEGHEGGCFRKREGFEEELKSLVKEAMKTQSRKD